MTECAQPERHLDLEGACNLRDIGGYPTPDGSHTRWKTFLRSGTMHQLTPTTQEALTEYGIRTIIDLRMTPETRSQANVLADSAAFRYCHVNMIGDDFLESNYLTRETGTSADKILRLYRGILDQRQTCIGEILAILARADRRPAVYHCAGGKDRTGIISALLLGLAGVPAEIIADDYGLSARYLMDRYLSEESPEKGLYDISTWQDYQREFCPPEGMLEVLHHLEREYSGIEGYVRATGLSDEQIRSLRCALIDN